MGRPKKPDIVGVKVRLARALVAQLEAAAEKHEQSFNAECARRLGSSFREEELFGGEAGRRWMHHIANTFVIAGERHYRDHIRPKQKTDKADEGLDVALWINEPGAYQAAMIRVIEELMVNQPKITPEKFKLQMLSLEGRVKSHFVNKEIREKRR
jgi:hypothetical protein